METQRLILRRRTQGLMIEVLSQSKENQVQFFGFDTIEETKSEIDRIQNRFENKNIGYEFFDLIEKDTDLVIGSGGFHTWVKEHSRAEIGYRLHDQFRGIGFMREAIEQMLLYGFKEMKLNRIEAFISPDNQNSINIVEHFGFVKEGVLRKHYFLGTHFADSVCYSLLNSEYKT